MAEEACAGNPQAGFCEEGSLQLRDPLLDAGSPPGYGSLYTGTKLETVDTAKGAPTVFR